MGLADLKTHTGAPEKTQDEPRNVAFRMRIASQQFLKHHSPLLRAFVRMGGDSKSIVKRGVFEEKAREARTLAIAITAHVMAKPPQEVTMNEARHFRLEAAEIIANAWEEGRQIDIPELAAQVAAAVATADDAYDDETVEWSKISGNGSATMTAASVTLSLAESVAIYDFRLGRQMVLTTLSATVVEATRDAVNIMSPEAATIEDRRSLSQTTMRAFCSIMSQIYEEAARESLKQLVSLPEEKRKAWLRRQAPFELVVGKFRIWTSDIAQIAASAARETLAATREQSSPPSSL